MKRSLLFNIMDRLRYGWGALELQRQTADDAFGRVDDEQLVVDRLIRRRLAEEVSHRDQHLPLGVAEIHERQRLPDLHVEARIERRRRRLRSGARKSVA